MRVTGSDNLSSHPFVREVLKPLSPMLGLALDAPKDRSLLKAWRAANRAKLTREQQYCRRIHVRMNNLLSVLDRAGRAQRLLRRSPGPHSTRRYPISRVEWVEYHFMVITASLTSVMDCCVHLVADVYRLGLPDRQATLDAVTKNEWVAGSAAAKALTSLQKDLGTHRQRRNRVLHQGEQADVGELSDPEWLQELSMLTWSFYNLDDFPFPFDRRMLNKAWVETLREVDSKLNDILVSASGGVASLLSSLLPTLRERAAQLRG